MTRKATLVIWGLSLLSLSGRLFAQEETPRPVQVTTSERLKFAAGGTVHVEGSYGYLNIEGWDLPEVELTVTKSAKGYYKSRDRENILRRFDLIRVSAERKSEKELFISTIHKGKDGVLLDYDIRVPRDSKLVIHHSSSYVFVENVAGDIEAASHAGDITLILPEAGMFSVDAKSRFGTITSDFADATQRRYLLAGKGCGGTLMARKKHAAALRFGGCYLGSERFVHDAPQPSQRICLRMGFGNIEIKSTEPVKNEMTKPTLPAVASGQ